LHRYRGPPFSPNESSKQKSIPTVKVFLGFFKASVRCEGKGTAAGRDRGAAAEKSFRGGRKAAPTAMALYAVLWFLCANNPDVEKTSLFLAMTCLMAGNIPFTLDTGH